MERSERTASARPPALAIAAAPPAAIVTLGRQLGRIEIVAKLGSGGMADVWLGRIRSQGDFVRLVAVKTVHADMCRDRRSREMFLREAAIAASIRHANVVDVHDVGEEAGVLYQVMTLVEGENLATLLGITPEPLPIGVVVSVVGDALLGLHAAHEAVDEQGRPRLLVHRDVSPQNILVGLDGVARVSDFGIAKALGANDETTGSMRGKCGYFSPEQARQAPLDRRSDVFAMGIVLWECLAGRRLFRHETLVDTLSNVLGGPIPDPRELRPSVPGPIVAVTLRALERDVERRYPTADAMASDLLRAARASGCLLPRSDVAATIERLAGTSVRTRRAAITSLAADAPRSAPASEAAKPTKRHAILVPIVGVAIVLAAIAGFFVVRGDAAARAPHRSDDATDPATSASVSQASPSAGVAVASAPTTSEASPKASTTAPAPAVTSKAPHRAPSRRPASPSRKAPFDENPFGSSGSP